MDENGKLYSYKLFDIEERLETPTKNVFMNISNLLKVNLNQSNHYKMQRKIDVTDLNFFLPITKNPF